MQWYNKAIVVLKQSTSFMDAGDLVEIIIIAFLVYHIMLWIKNSRAWSLLKGLIVILVFLLIAIYFEMTTILWIAKNVLTFAVIAMIIVLQPELRRALEQLGKKNIIYSILPFDSNRRVEETFSDKSINEITKACTEMSKVKTGALIVIEQTDLLSDYERTGIEVDGVVTSQLLINIFEHNTPLHDGAIIIRGNRITSATCYLPLSDSMGLGKELGTRHRAGVGITEVTDALVIIVSEQTGKISVACDGDLDRGLDSERLKERLRQLQADNTDEEKGKRKWKGRRRSIK